ncbi:hypothetical protein MKX01_018488, partial [Papaver californicum]
SYFCCWGQKNSCGGYNLGKIVVKKLNDADKFWNEGVGVKVSSKILVDKCQSEVVREIPTNQGVAMESKLEEMWRLLADEESPVRIIGIYGMGGVGKTTLMKNGTKSTQRKNSVAQWDINVTIFMKSN